ncbi:MAG: phosphatidylserine decarboxylase family protein [Candidatus Egerieousia sp.]
MIHKEGRSSVFVVLLIFAGLSIIMFASFGCNFVTVTISLLLLVWFLFISYFFRDPKREVIPDKDALVSSADGKVVIIRETEENEFLHTKCKMVSVFMSVYDVHVNYYPVDGKILYYKHHWGKYVVAWHPKSSTKNERTSIAIETAGGKKILVRQIAGYVARRIVCYAKEGADVKQGQQLGFIKFGSRVDFFLPLDAEILVKKGDTVVACQTPIARL